jgi:hypothetical protein
VPLENTVLTPGMCRPLQLAGKLSSPGQLNAVPSGQLFHMLDQNSNENFLVDTMPATASYHIIFQDRKFSWKFLLAKGAFPILGVDFLRFLKLGVDPSSNMLTDIKGKWLTGLAQPSPTTATW